MTDNIALCITLHNNCNETRHVAPMADSMALYSLTNSLTNALTHSLPHSLTPSLPHSLTPSLPHSLTPSLTHSLTHATSTYEHARAFPLPLRVAPADRNGHRLRTEEQHSGSGARLLFPTLHSYCSRQNLSTCLAFMDLAAGFHVPLAKLLTQNLRAAGVSGCPGSYH